VSRAGRPVLLLVDDEERILAALRRTLRREGFEILCAESPARGLALLEERAVDVILSDHKMPGMSGLAFLARAARLRPGAARLLITGWPEEVPTAELASVGVRALVPKPWDDAELKATLHRHARQ
jgi:response regulator RpfG family c-di-GMP phosphodiesterase